MIKEVECKIVKSGKSSLQYLNKYIIHVLYLTCEGEGDKRLVKFVNVTIN
jgi:hypothetical protein